ncbi:MAG: PilZ domain-containing protein [Candidatus Omnitrophica bacterium]|nr:PilZ domain-containing protein [Candidatus Omnitrophota bacterium]
MKKYDTIKDKRVYNRFKVNFSFEIKGDDFSFRSEMKDISCSGLFCQTEHYIAPKTELKVVLNIPICQDSKIEKKKFTSLGKVVRIDPQVESAGADYNLGISFDPITQAEKDLILRFISQRNVKESEELRDMYYELKKTIIKLEALEDSHPTAEHFCKVITQAIKELDEVVNSLDQEITEIKKASFER